MTYVATATPEEGADRIGLPAEKLRRIAEAIAAAEKLTSAEIRVVVAKDPVIQHPFFPVMWSAIAALVLPWIILFIWRPSALVTLEVQAIIFMVAAGVLMLPQLAERVVPRLALKAAVRTAAIETFLSYGMSRTTGHSGVLIFAAAQEHMVEVVADQGAHDQLGPAAWAEICSLIAREARQGRLADGLVHGVERAGELLSGPLPYRPGDVNELGDRVIIL